MSRSALIVEDHPLYRDALTHLLRRVVGEDAVAAASSAEEGLRLARKMNDLKIVLLDLALPGITGMEALNNFREAFPGAIMIVVSASEERRDATAAIKAGARIFVSKAVGTDVMTDIVRRALAGDAQCPNWVTPTGAQVVEQAGESPLTPRQQEILELIAKGLSNKEIGLRLELAEVTVKMHVSSIFRALNVASRTQAVREAYRVGLCRD
jgi:two-component system, NarL family, nitrate/nitrite response regulator NarL